MARRPSRLSNPPSVTAARRSQRIRCNGGKRRAASASASRPPRSSVRSVRPTSPVKHCRTKYYAERLWRGPPTCTMSLRRLSIAVATSWHRRFLKLPLQFVKCLVASCELALLVRESRHQSRTATTATELGWQLVNRRGSAREQHRPRADRAFTLKMARPARAETALGNDNSCLVNSEGTARHPYVARRNQR